MKQKIVNILVIFSGILTLIQGFIPIMPIPKTDIVTTSAIIMFLVNITTIWKETLIQLVKKAKLYTAISLAVLATVGAVNHLFEFIPISEGFGQWLRFAVTAATMALNSDTLKAIFGIKNIEEANI